MTNDIQINAGVSIAYFVMSLLTILVLYISHEAATYMNIANQPYLLLVYGLLCLSLTIVGIVEMDAAVGGAQQIYNKLSQNAQEFFENDVTKLQNQRYENT